MRYDSVQIWMLTVTFVVPVLIGASCQEFMKAVAVTASAVFLGNLLYGTLFGGWDGFGGLERSMLEARLDRAAFGTPGRGRLRVAAAVAAAQPRTRLGLG